MIIKLLKTIDKKLDIENWLCWLLGLVLILRIPSFFEPYSYGDEMIYLVLGEGIRQSLTLYRDIHDNKPPLLYILAAIAGSLFWFKVILMFWNMVTVVLFSKLAKILFPKNSLLVKVSTVVFAVLTTIPLFEGNIVNSELFMVGFTILAFIILLSKDHNFRNLFLAGVMFSIGALFKIPSAFDLPVIIVFWVILWGFKKEGLIKIIRNSIVLIFGFLAPILLTFVWYYFKGALNQYIVAAFLQNVGYLSSFRPDDIQRPFLEKNLPLLIRAGVVAMGSLILFWKRQSLSKEFIFTSLWLLFSLFGVTLSERPYPHYFIQAVPAIAILIGLLISKKNIEQVLAIIPLTLAFFVPVYFDFYHYPTVAYYSRFVRFVTGQMDKTTYFETFGGNTNRNYEIANLLAESTLPGEKVFIWEDGVTIYALSRRLPPIKYVAGYHIKDFSSKAELAGQLEKSTPRTIILFPENEYLAELASLLQEKYIEIPLVDNAFVYRLRSELR